MATKSTSTAKKKPAKKRESAKARDARLQAERQVRAVIVFAVGLLLGALTFIEGTSLWQTLHMALFGLFGFCAYLLGPVLIYIATLLASDTRHDKAMFSSVTLGLLMLFICAVLQVVGAGHIPASGDILEIVKAIYLSGVNLQNGGLFGAILGLPLLLTCGRTGALIIISLSIFVLVMIVSGSTLAQLYRNAVQKPVQKVGQVYSETVDEIARHIPEPGSVRRKFNIDVPLDDDDPADDGETDEIEQCDAKQGLDKAMESFYAEQVEERAEAFFAETVPTDEEQSDATSAQPDTAPLAVPAEPNNEYIDEIIRRMATRQQSAIADARQPEAEAQNSLLPKAEERDYVFPSITLLNEPQPRSAAVDSDELRENAQRLVDTLQSFGVQTRIIDISKGPAVTRYELQPSAGVKISKITGLADDIALNLAASGVRIEAPIPNKAAVGIEVPNRDISMVTLREVIDSGAFVEAKSKLSVAFGRDIAGNITIADLAKMPHVLIAGATGSGKSVCINSIIMSLLYKASDKDVKLLMIDPKVVELGIYNGIPHLLVPVVTDPKKAAGALNWAVGEMLKRYKMFAESNVRDLQSYNEMASKHETLPTIPQIVIIIDELSDLMMTAPKDVEDAIVRLTQMGRASGIHLVIATQRPSVDVITGLIKANVPSRVAFAVSSQVDSRTILDSGGAEKLLGRGDMLFNPVGASKPLRVQGCFVTNKEVERVVSFIKEGQGQSRSYSDEVMDEIERNVPQEKGSRDGTDNSLDDNDDLIMDAIECVVEAGQASTSMIQRRLKVGYARAGRLVDEMEQMGIVGPFEGSKPRQVLISKERWYEMKLQKSE